MRIVLLGAPGSGKGTQAGILAKRKGVPHISTGEMLREAVAAGTRFGKKARATIDAGDLVSDEIMLGIISERLARADATEGFILDGFPRTRQQARDLEDLLDEVGSPLDAAVLMDVDPGMLMKRLTGRRTCSVTGKTLNIHFSPQAELDACREAGGELLRRDDDNEDTIRNRLEVYRENTEPVVEFYRKRDRLKVVNAEGEVDEITQRIADLLD